MDSYLSFLLLFIIVLGFLVLTGSTPESLKLFPIKAFGQKSRINITSQLCESPINVEVANHKTVDILLPFVENPTRVGYLCGVSTARLTCYLGFLKLDFNTTSEMSVPDWGSCKDLISKIEHGHDDGVREIGPECYFLRTSIKTVHSFIVKRINAPFSAEQNGVLLSDFPGGVCNQDSCTSYDQKVIWFLKEGEDKTCTNIRPGFLEIENVIRHDKNEYIIESSAHTPTNIKEFCLLDHFCGHKTLLGPNFHGLILQNLPINVAEFVDKNVQSCSTNSRVKSLDVQHFVPRMDTISRIRMKMLTCSDIIQKGLVKGELSERYLSLLSPSGEGIYPGYRLENGHIYMYSLLYIWGKFKPHIGRDGRVEGWSIVDLAGKDYEIIPSLCHLDDNLINTIESTDCMWFNGISMSGSTLIYPTMENHYMYQYPSKTFRISNTTITNKGNRQPSDTNQSLFDYFDSLLGENYVLIGSSLLGVMIFLVLLVCLFKCCKRKRLNTDNEVESQFGQFYPHRSQFPAIQGREGMGGFELRPVPALTGPSGTETPMLEWFG